MHGRTSLPPTGFGACDPHWIRGHGKTVRTPGSVVVTIAADGWPVVAEAIQEPAGLISVSVTGADLDAGETPAKELPPGCS